MDLEKLKKIVQKTNDIKAGPRYQNVLDLFLKTKLLRNNHGPKNPAAPIDINDAIWAAEYEPRFLEILPAAVIKFPEMFFGHNELVDQIVQDIKANKTTGPSLGYAEFEKMKHWAQKK